VSYNSSEQLEIFLKNALSSVSSPTQIFIADNASADVNATAKLAEKFGVNLIRSERNLGYGGAVNLAVNSIPKKLTKLVISNPDSLLNTEAVKVLTAASSKTSIGAVGPQILNENGSVYPSGRSIPSLRIGIGHALFANIWPSNPWTKKYHSNAYLGETSKSTGWVSGSCFAIDRLLFESVGGFDDHYFMYFEDVDLGYRLGKLGYTNLYVPEVSITHIGGESTKAIKKTMLRIHHESAMRFIQVKYKGVLWAPVRGIIRIGLALRFWLQARNATT
jgi:N-acetylglucosaminyl-diphospho-decaprenol L-rhamnosyltransferase